MAIVFEKSLNTLVFDRDRYLREGLRNFLLASGFTHVQVAVSLQAALIDLHREPYDLILLGVSPPVSVLRRLARVAHCHQPEAKIILLVAASERHGVTDVPDRVILKERMYTDLLALL